MDVGSNSVPFLRKIRENKTLPWLSSVMQLCPKPKNQHGALNVNMCVSPIDAWVDVKGAKRWKRWERNLMNLKNVGAAFATMRGWMGLGLFWGQTQTMAMLDASNSPIKSLKLLQHVSGHTGINFCYLHFFFPIQCASISQHFPEVHNIQ